MSSLDNTSSWYQNNRKFIEKNDVTRILFLYYKYNSQPYIYTNIKIHNTENCFKHTWLNDKTRVWDYNYSPRPPFFQTDSITIKSLKKSYRSLHNDTFVGFDLNICLYFKFGHVTNLK